MAPPPSNTTIARPVARYRKGKAPVIGYIDSDSDNDSTQPPQHHHHHQPGEEAQFHIASLSSGTKELLKNPNRTTAGIVVRLQDQQHPKEGGIVKEEEESSSEYETDSEQDEPLPPPSKPVFRKPGVVHVAEEKKEQESSEEDDDDESSEEEKPMLKPIFVPKRQRATIAIHDEAKTIATATTSTEQENPDAEALQRRAEATQLAADRIRRSLAEQEHETSQLDLQDTDGLEPEAEFTAWRIRELERIQRDRESIESKRREKQQIEHRRQMPESQRLQEDVQHATQSRLEKSQQQRGKQGFLQKYYHKGSFFQDMDILKKRDYSEKTESQVDVSKLPSIMQVRGFGQKGRSKWTHLANEDTSKMAPKLNERPKGCFVCAGDHLKQECPDREKREQEREKGRAGDRYREKDREGDRDRYSDRDRERDKERDRYRDRDSDKKRDRDSDRKRERYRESDRERDRSRDHDRDHSTTSNRDSHRNRDSNEKRKDQTHYHHDEIRTKRSRIHLS